MPTQKMYNVYRYYFSGAKPRLQRRNLTLEQAREYCSRDDTSSSTHPNGRNGVHSEWFDGFVSQ